MHSTESPRSKIEWSWGAKTRFLKSMISFTATRGSHWVSTAFWLLSLDWRDQVLQMFPIQFLWRLDPIYSRFWKQKTCWPLLLLQKIAIWTEIYQFISCEKMVTIFVNSWSVFASKMQKNPLKCLIMHISGIFSVLSGKAEYTKVM